MDELAFLIGTLSGLRFIQADLEPPVILATSVAMHITYAVICHVFAVQTGRSGRAWTVAGFLGGALATVLLLVLAERDPPLASPS